MAGGSARDLRRAAALFRGPSHLPRLWFFTDPIRTPDPARIAARLPVGTAVVFRHFGARDRRWNALALRRTCSDRDLTLLIGADWRLAEEIAADGVHLPERLAAEAPRLKARRPDWLVTVAAHSRGAASAAAGADAIVLSPVYPSSSPSAGAPLTLSVARRIARGLHRPCIALGGVNLEKARELAAAGFAGIAGIDLFRN
ncbi:MAG: thiamine phosphate synthase [Hyphomonadaceae bacterium]|nr:thiamine phosphate synthase [Hyphomonadaceae bacterium]